MVKRAAPKFQEFQQAFTQHIRAPKTHPRPAGVSAHGMRIYTALVHHNIENFLLRCFPILRQTLSARRWRALVQTFFAEHRCRTPLFREIPAEFVGFLQTQYRAQGDPDLFLCELAHYEWMELVLATAQVPASFSRVHIDSEGDLERGRPQLAPIHALLRYTYAVHIVSGRKPQRAPAQATYLFLYRDAAYQVRFFVLNAVSARLIELLQSRRRSGAAALRKIARELGHPQPHTVLAGGMQTLTALKRAGAVLGARLP